MSLTARCTDDDWALRSLCLQTDDFPDHQRSEIMAEGLKDALNSWNLTEDRLVCMTPSLQCFGHKPHNATGENFI